MKKLKEVKIIEDCSEAVSSAAVYEEGVLYLKKTKGGYLAGNYLIEDLEHTDKSYLERVYNRVCKEPVDIAVTDRIMLRETTLEDAPELYRIMQTEKVKRFVDTDPVNYADFCEKLEAYRSAYDFYDCGLWGIIERKSNKLIGRCGISYSNIEGTILPELGFLLDPDYTGRSYAYEAALAALDYAFGYLGEKAVYARADKENSRSIKLLKRLGFEQKKELKSPQENIILYCIEAK